MKLQALIPHAGDMCLLDRVVVYSEQEIQCVTYTHLLPANPLRRDGKLSALHLVEYAAQAMAAHGALTSGGVQRGMLAAVRDIQLHADRIDNVDAELTVTATRRIAQTTGSLYDFRVQAATRLLAEGRIAIAIA